jgi:hypothetical protein
MLNQVSRVTPLPNYRLEIEFQDGVYGTLDLSDRLFGEMFEPLRDEAVFRKVALDEFGAICWPNGADLAPDAIHQKLVVRRFPPRLRAESKLKVREKRNSPNSRAECLEQLLEAFSDIADRDDIHQAAERLARVQEWIKRDAERDAGELEADTPTPDIKQSA